MRQMSYTIKVSLLNGAIQEFLNRRGIGMYTSEAKFRSNLAAWLKGKGFEVEEERAVNMANNDTLIPDIIVYIQGKCLPIELKYNNTSITEYEKDEEKCERYVDEFRDVQDAYCIFVSNIDHRDYRPDEWIECDGCSTYQYVWIQFEKMNDLYI